MIKIQEAIIVEGIYDKMKLEQFVDAAIFPTNGFALFKDREKIELIRQLARKGIAILITDHAAREILQITDRTYVVSDGRILCSGTADEIIQNEQVRQKYLGEMQLTGSPVDQSAPSPSLAPMTIPRFPNLEKGDGANSTGQRQDKPASDSARPKIIFSDSRKRRHSDTRTDLD